MTKTIPELLAQAQLMGRRERLESREWLCVKCRKRFRFRPEHVEHTIQHAAAPVRMHCEIPMLLTHKEAKQP